MKKGILSFVFCATALAGLCACSSDDHGAPKPPVIVDSGADGPSGVTGPLRAFTAPRDPGGGGILFAVSGEALALTGYAFPPAQPDDPAFVDGWNVTFSHLLVTVDKITLSNNPDTVPGDQSQLGSKVAEVDGPWAVDLAHSDPRYLPGKGGAGEEAVPIAALSSQNENGDEPFATDGTRYAFGFDAVTAAPSAIDVNLDEESLADYEKMIEDHCVVLYVGTATFKGDKSDPSCYPPDRHGWPDTVNFTLCFESPTSYVNCQNPDNDPAGAFPNEEHQRGIAFQTNASVIGQLTIHTDHPFWDSVLHDSPTHFDQFAARVVGMDAGVPTTTLELTRGVDYTAYTDARGTPLEWRYCTPPPTDVHPKFTGPMRFDPESVPHSPNADPSKGLRDYYDFATYDQSTQGHLNSDGLCFVRRDYTSPE